MLGQRGMQAGLYFETLFWHSGPPGRLPVVVLPGLLSDGRQVRRLLRELGRPALVVDPLGSGHSDAPAQAGDYALPAVVPRLFALLDAVGVAAADLIGLSMGGMWAQHALLADGLRPSPRFRSALLVGTDGWVSPRLRSILLGLRAAWTHGLSALDSWRVLQPLLFAPEFLERPSTVPLLELLASEPRSSQAAVLGQLDALLGHNLVGELGSERRVRRLIAGQLDLLMPPCTQAALATTLGGIPYELISGGGHSIWIEQPAAVADSLRGALAAD